MGMVEMGMVEMGMQTGIEMGIEMKMVKYIS